MRTIRLTLVLLCAAGALAQSSTVLLERGIYLEETTGDPEGAIRVYKQILASGAPANKPEARNRLRVCLAKKSPDPEAGAHYTDPLAGYSFTLPPGWDFAVRLPSGGGPGNCADFVEPAGKGVVTLCAKPEHWTSAEIDPRLLRGEVEMLSSRKTTRLEYTLRPGTPVFGSLFGQRTLSIVADLRRGRDKRTEWITWIQTEKTRASITGIAPAADFDRFRARFAPILNSIRLP